MNGLKKISEFDLLIQDGTERIPAIQEDGGGGFTNGYLPITGLPSVNIYNSDGTLLGNREIDLDTFTLLFSNSLGDVLKLNTDRSVQVFKEAGFNGLAPTAGYGVNSFGSTAGVRGEGGFYGLLGLGSGAGVFGYSSAGYGAEIATSTGIGLRVDAPVNQAIHSNGRAYVEEYGLGAGMLSSALFQLNSTSKGFLPPRMTTAQINAISSPAEGLVVYNTDRKRLETYNGTYWKGESMLYTVHALTSSPTDSATIYFGNLTKAPTTTANISKVHIENSGVIRKANIYCYSGTAGTSENWSFYIRLNNTTDYLIETIGTATNERTFNNNALNIPVVEGDYFEIKTTNPPWSTAPLTTATSGNIIVE